MKTKLELINETEIKGATNALFSWFESQDIKPYNAFIVVSHATGTMLGMLSKNEKELKSGLVAVQKDMKASAKNAYKHKHKLKLAE